MSDGTEEKFVHLHLHTQYSALDGAIKIKDLMPRLQELGMSSCAITDHGSMYGIVDFYKSCKSAKIHPVIGSEFYISPGSLHDRSYERGEDSNYHLVLLAENDKGLHNLYQLSSIAFLDGFYRKPRIDKETLAKYSEGVIALSACLGGEICKKFFKDGYKAALEAALEYDKIMGRGNYFLEIQENGIPEQTIINRQLVSISQETGIPLVATCDCHYLKHGDHISHNILMQVQYSQGSNMEKRVKRVKPLQPGEEKPVEVPAQPSADISNFISDGFQAEEEFLPDEDRKKEKSTAYSDQLYVKSPEEIARDFAYAPEAVENTVKIAKRCNISIKFGELRLPKFDVPEGFTIASYFISLSREGLKKRLERVSEEKHPIYWKRLEEEMEVITLKGFDGYFLIVWDFINYSRRTGIPVGPGRGSGAGSLVAYSLAITDIDPIRFDLLFERFLNPERVSMPDFDIDFCIKGREEVIKYVGERYGSDRVCQIITFGTLKPRAAVRDVGRVFNILLADVDKMAKAIPEGPAITSFKVAFETDPSLIETFKKYPQGMELLEHAKNIEGLIRNIGIHAAGVIIADKPILEYAPLCRGPKGEVITQFEKGTSEKIGLIKFDFLGLKNLTIIDDAVKRIRRSGNPDFDINAIPLDDEDTFDVFQRGDTMGVFQLESDGMKSLLKKLRPSVLEDIIAVNALYRPGPINSGMLDDFVARKHGEQAITYDLPELADILKETYGVIVYQEQVMQIACRLGGYTLGSADILRRAMGKKDKEEMARQRVIFLEGNEKTKSPEDKIIPGARVMGFDMEKSSAVFDLMAQFAEYGFNKSHSAAYALIAYQTAYMKAKFPLQYMSALISGDLSVTSDVVRYIMESIRMGIKILPPDINKSYCDFRAEGDGIRFGLGSLKSVGYGVIESYIKEREENGPYKSLYDFAQRIDYKNLSRKAVEAMIKAGAFDCFGHNRRQLLQVFDNCLNEGNKKFKMKEGGILSLEDFMTEDEKQEEYYPDVAEMPEKELLKMEKETLGFYFSSHPLKEISNFIEMVSTNLDKVRLMPSDSPVNVAGIVKSVRPYITKMKREKMAFVMLEDLHGEMDIVVFPRLYATIAHLLEEDKIIAIKGVFTRNDDDNEKVSIRAEEIIELGEAIEKFTAGLTLRFDVTRMTADRICQLRTVISRHRGRLPIRLSFERPQQYRAMLKLSEEYRVRPTTDFLAEAANIPGFVDMEAIPFGERIFQNESMPEDFDDISETA